MWCLRWDPGSLPGGGNRTPLKTQYWGRSCARALDCVPVDPFTLVVVGGLAVVFAVLWLLGRYYPGSGLEQLGLRSARELTERREELEAEDLDQLLRAHNERKRARGEAEVSAEELEAELLREREQAQRRRWPAA
jgi:CBS-domain-containing membrane protein